MTVVAAPSLGFYKALSGMLGSISLTAWICLLVPQVLKNYRAHNADALSMTFLFVWLGGDLANLCGAYISRLAPAALAIGSYFIFADIVLIGQCMYYHYLGAVPTRRNLIDEHASNHSHEETPFLQSRRGSSHLARAALNRDESLNGSGNTLAAYGDGSESLSWRRNGASLMAVYMTGALAWIISYGLGILDNTETISEPRQPEAASSIGVVMGYASAACYLFARIPQIIKNHRERSCHGLAIMFFMLSLSGNLTYGLSLIFYSPTKSSIMQALPWLIGSFGTMIQDCVIFAQFWVYRSSQRASMVM